MGIIIAILVLSILIFFHELGHFTAARYFGVQVNVFSIGFGKKLYSRTIGTTQWSISAIPLGGYVQMKGQDDTDPTRISYDTDSYNAKKPWQRIVILLAGPFANFLLAFLLYVAIANIGVPKLLPSIGTVGENTPALASGLQPNDKITQINGNPIRFWDDISPIIDAKDGDLFMTIERDNMLLSLQLTPKVIEDKNMFGETITRRIIGITSSGVQETITFGPIESLQYAWDETKRASFMIVQSIQKLITGVIGAENLSGVITIVDVTSKASAAGITALFFFTALISVNLGVLNLLPIPALDGGHIMFNLYEMFTGKTASEKSMIAITLFGWSILISLMLLGLYNDINRIWGAN